MKRNEHKKISGWGRLFVAWALAYTSMPFQNVYAELRSSTEEQANRGSSLSQIAAAQKASEAAVARMNANLSSLGHQSPAVLPGQIAANEIQAIIAEKRSATRQQGGISSMLANTITAGGLFGEIVDLQMKTKSTGRVETSVFSGNVLDANGLKSRFEGKYEHDAGAGIFTATIRYQDGRVSNAQFNRTEDNDGYMGLVKTKSKGSNIAQHSSIWVSANGLLTYSNTTVYHTAEKEWKVLVRSNTRSETVVGPRGELSKSVVSERVEGDKKIQARYSVVDGKTKGTIEESDGNSIKKTSFSSDPANGKTVWNFDSVQTFQNGTTVTTHKVIDGDKTIFTSVKRGIVADKFEGAIIGDWNLNGKVDKDEPWGPYTEKTSGTSVRSKDTVVTKTKTALSFESGVQKPSLISESVENGVLFVSVMPGLPADRVPAFKESDQPTLMWSGTQNVSQFTQILADGSKMTGKTATQADGSYITKSLTVAKDGTKTETITQGSPLGSDKTRTVVSHVVALAPNGDKTTSVVYNKVDNKGVSVEPILIQFTKTQTDGSTVTGQTIRQRDGSIVSESLTLKKDGTKIRSITKWSALINGARVLVTTSESIELNGTITQSNTTQTVDAQGNPLKEKVTEYQKILNNGTIVTGVITTQTDGSYVSTSTAIAKDGPRTETKIKASALVNGKRTLITQSISRDPKGNVTQSVTSQVVDANGNPITQPLVQQGVARYNAMGQLVGIY